MTGLLQNEWIKFRKQTGYRVCLIILAVLLILMPLGSKLLESIFSGYDSDYSRYYQDMAENCREYGDTLYAEYYTGKSGAYAFFEEHGFGTDNWRFLDYIEDYTRLYTSEHLYAKALDGTLEPERLIDIGEFNLIPQSALDENGKLKDTFDLNAAWNKKHTERLELESVILNADAQSVVRDQIQVYSNGVSSAKTTVSLLEKKAAASPDDQQVAYQLAVARLSLEAQEEMLAGYQWLLTHGLGRDDWQYEAVNEVLSGATQRYPELAAGGCFPEGSRRLQLQQLFRLCAPYR